MKALCILFSMAALFFFISCKRSVSGPAYAIKMRLDKEDTFSQNIQMIMKMKTFTGESFTKMQLSTSFEVLDSDQYGKDLKLTYRNIHLISQLTKNKFTDSVINLPNYQLIGKSVICKLSRDNQFVDISGMDTIINNSLKDKSVRFYIQENFSKKQLNNYFGLMFSLYPKDSVRVGDNWEGTSSLNMGGIDMLVNIKYTLLSIRNGLAEIAVDGTLDEKGRIAENRMDIKLKISGDQKGTYVIRMADGYLDHGNYKINMTSEMQMMGFKNPISINADFVIKGK